MQTFNGKSVQTIVIKVNDLAQPDDIIVVPENVFLSAGG
jgi:hypothetical protein